MIIMSAGPAQITHSARDKTVYRGNNITFYCNIDQPGRPETLEYSWYVGGNKLPDIRSQQMSHIMTKEEGGGRISCEARNSAGWGGMGHLEMRVLVGPTFTQTLPPHTSVLDSADNVVLTCEVGHIKIPSTGNIFLICQVIE